ncbi:MAG: DUF3501 family protein [Candidatus Eisenbacteria bacterium]|uniref:DUF3501 family protein n=1 Tax=Eiseniibacteriota bacterium TaxID=2212470 RepID=A0A948RXK5_UNCEI|nr:DUF3501 family protein [Candidatus Eisenbacteria bacterium]MBU1950210.1 DUF3501 family protein [Candidatus Eisenbacteria bacterium]MBU2691393.1 DUF3501 family protein [Candidatus Eisenbacteria bacterium]
MMLPITLDDILSLDEYEQERNEHRKEMIRLKVKRRISIEDVLTLVFENRSTVLHQIHEMIRAERLIESDAIARELEVYNEFVPKENQLSGTLLFELRDLNKMTEDLERFRGFGQGVHLWFEIPGTDRIPAVFDSSRDEDGKIPSVYHLSFTFTKEQAEIFCKSRQEVVLVLEHPALKMRTVLSEELRGELIDDLS